MFLTCRLLTIRADFYNWNRVKLRYCDGGSFVGDSEFRNGVRILNITSQVSGCTPVYIAAGEIYGGETHMIDLQSRFPILMNMEKLSSAEELGPFSQYVSQMAALDYIVSVESDDFIPSYSGNMVRAGHRRFHGHRKTVIPDRKALVRLFDKVDSGLLDEGDAVSQRIAEVRRKRQGSPRKRKGPVSGTKGSDRFSSEEAFYENPLPDCFCQLKDDSAVSI